MLCLSWKIIKKNHKDFIFIYMRIYLFLLLITNLLITATPLYKIDDDMTTALSLRVFAYLFMEIMEMLIINQHFSLISIYNSGRFEPITFLNVIWSSWKSE